MSKIIAAMTVMSQNPNKITDVTSSEGELFYKYEGKYIWSCKKSDEEGTIHVFFYPDKTSIEGVLQEGPPSWDIPMVSYHSSDFPNSERQAFEALYGLLKEKQFGVDKVLEDIINRRSPY